ncbi:MAG TPA: DNA topology modulation protein [Sedimentibacter sp.]|nr:DNA topology modulation protein [Pseudobacteroides sp.]HRC81836.1 DNA topology modulation protein [Sedimentibacter sp.]
MKVAVIGYSGSGKSTLAAKLGEIYNCPVLYLDRIHFKENWTERDDETAKAMLKEFMDKNGSWVIDGNYNSLLRGRRLEEADMIVFMNFSRLTCLRQAIKRYKTYKGKTRESMADNCSEKMDMEFIKWILLDGRSREKKVEYAETIRKYKQKIVILRNKKEIASFLETLTQNK